MYNICVGLILSNDAAGLAAVTYHEGESNISASWV